MKKRTLLLFIVIPLIVLITVMITVAFYYRTLLFDTAGGETFTGTITAASVDCKSSNKDSNLTIDEKVVTLKPSHAETDEEYGFTDLNLCGVFGNTGSYGTVNKRSGDTNNGSWLIGRDVEVRADKIDETHYTLKGSSDFYVLGD